jgi:hypothetical protein
MSTDTFVLYSTAHISQDEYNGWLLSIRFFQCIPFSPTKPLQNPKIPGTIIYMIVPPSASFGMLPL